ncbi:MAG: hypothetical protein FJ100_16205 [Deltaproteobacteria bacterium]|nr:hypothetical protein [Deltaproteobacteria bacterium]
MEIRTPLLPREPGTTAVAPMPETLAQRIARINPKNLRREDLVDAFLALAEDAAVAYDRRIVHASLESLKPFVIAIEGPAHDQSKAIDAALERLKMFTK